MLLPVLNGCVTKTIYKPVKYELPEFPVAGSKVADELYKLCLPDMGQCKHINEWLNDLYMFNIKYRVYYKYSVK